MNVQRGPTGFNTGSKLKYSICCLRDTKNRKRSIIYHTSNKILKFPGSSSVGPPCIGRIWNDLLTGYADRPAAELVDQASYDGPGAHVEPAEEAPHPRHRALVRVEVGHQHGQQHSEAVGDAVDDEVVHEAGEDDDPAPAAVGRSRQLEHGHHI